MPKEKVLAIPVKETFASASTVNDPILDVAETPDGCTTAEPSIAADPSDEEKEIPLTSTSEPRPVVKTNSPHAPKSYALLPQPCGPKVVSISKPVRVISASLRSLHLPSFQDCAPQPTLTIVDPPH